MASAVAMGSDGGSVGRGGAVSPRIGVALAEAASPPDAPGGPIGRSAAGQAPPVAWRGRRRPACRAPADAPASARARGALADRPPRGRLHGAPGRTPPRSPPRASADAPSTWHGSPLGSAAALHRASARALPTLHDWAHAGLPSSRALARAGNPASSGRASRRWAPAWRPRRGLRLAPASDRAYAHALALAPARQRGERVGHCGRIGERRGRLMRETKDGET